MTKKPSQGQSRRAPVSHPEEEPGKLATVTTNMLYQEMFASSPDGLLLIDAETRRIIQFNDAACRQLGYTREEFGGLHISDLGAAETAEALEAQFQDALREGTVEFDTVQRTQTGEIRQVHLWLRRMALDGRAVLHAIFTDITERKQTKQALRRSLDLLDRTGRLAKIGGWELDLGTQALRWTEALYRIHEVDPAFKPTVVEAIKFYAPEAQPIITAAVQAAIEAGTPFDLDLPLVTGQGRHIWVRAQGAAERRDGKTVRLFGAFQDITERKLAEEAEAQRVAILDATPDLVGIADPDGRLVYLNRAGRMMLGIDELADPTRYHLQEFHNAANARIVVNEGIPTAMREGTWSGETELMALDGHTIAISQVILAHKSADGTLTRFSTIARDITERRRAQESLHLQSAALYAAADAIVITDRAGAIQWVNPAFTELTGYPVEEAFGQSPGNLLKSGKHPPEFYRNFWETILGGKTWHGEMINCRKDGSLYHEEQSVTPILDASGTISHFIAIKEDITERLQLEAQFRQAQKMESVGQLASGIAHDFNNLLTVITGMSELMLTQIRPDDPMHPDVQEIHSAGQRAATLTRQLLAFSRQQILEPQVLNLRAVVEKMESLLRHLVEESIDLVVMSAPDVGHVKADPGQIEQVITNLVVNARDAMPQGGSLTIELQNVTLDEEYARHHGAVVPLGPYVMLSVSDSGIGMDEATRARIFEPFFTTKGPDQGTGLGLSTAFGIVKQSQGFIWVYSEVGQGTTFRIYLPRVFDALESARPMVTVRPPSGTETILLVEDSAGLRRLVSRVLEPAGYAVLTAATGEEALRLLEEHQQPVHLLLTDLVMPGMSGRQLVEQLARTHPALKVLYMSGYTSDILVRHGVLEAQVAFLSKPFTAASLLRKVREALDSGPPRRPPAP